MASAGQALLAAGPRGAATQMALPGGRWLGVTDAWEGVERCQPGGECRVIAQQETWDMGVGGEGGGCSEFIPIIPTAESWEGCRGGGEGLLRPPGTTCSELFGPHSPCSFPPFTPQTGSSQTELVGLLPSPRPASVTVPLRTSCYDSVHLPAWPHPGLVACFL